METTSNNFYNSLEADQKNKFAILFVDKSEWYERRIDGTINHDKKTIDDAIFNRYKEALKDFIELQKDEVEYNLNSIYFANFACSKFFENKIDKSISFLGATFSGIANFISATFSDEANFYHVTFSVRANFLNATFGGKTNFIRGTFSDRANFSHTTFNGEANFSHTTFNGRANFYHATFSGKADFYDATFSGKADFSHATFSDKLTFLHAIFEKTFLLSNAKINTLDIENIKYEDANFLHIVSIDKYGGIRPLTKENFANKESVRLIKAHFEDAGNITEANKYFVIEQEKYIEALSDKDNKTENGKTLKLIPLYLNKYISNFGTDWLRSTLTLFLFGFIALFSYMTLRYSFLTFPNEFYMSGKWQTSNIPNTMALFVVLLLIYFININFDAFKQFRLKSVEIYKRYQKIFYFLSIFALAIFIYVFYDSDLFNLISKLINPINAFKDDDIYKGYEAFGMIVRIISATIIYQIIVAFRQFTRRG